MKAVVALRRFRAPMGHKKGGCWLQVAGGCCSQVQINVMLKQVGLYLSCDLHKSQR